MIRRFANIVTENRRRTCSLHRLDVSTRLFYPSTAAADAANERRKKNGGSSKMATLPRLPAPIMRFHPSPIWWSSCPHMDLFALLSPRRSEDRILCADESGRAVLCHADARSVQTMPSLSDGHGFSPTAISVARGDEEEDLYVLTHSAFDVLNFRSGPSGSRKCWHCDPLPPFNTRVRSHAVVDGGRAICVSLHEWMGGRRTYYFDTVERKRKWRPAAGGNWVLPFYGGAEYVPDLDL